MSVRRCVATQLRDQTRSQIHFCLIRRRSHNLRTCYWLLSAHFLSFWFSWNTVRHGTRHSQLTFCLKRPFSCIFLSTSGQAGEWDEFFIVEQILVPHSKKANRVGSIWLAKRRCSSPCWFVTAHSVVNESDLGCLSAHAWYTQQLNIISLPGASGGIVVNDSPQMTQAASG